VAAARETAEARVYAALAAATRSVDPGLPERLANLLQPSPPSRLQSCGRCATRTHAMARTTESSDVARKGIQARDVWFVMAGPGGCHRNW
jgi:hypothetical protein